jgi:hypothetical protein
MVTLAPRLKAVAVAGVIVPMGIGLAMSESIQFYDKAISTAERA